MLISHNIFISAHNFNTAAENQTSKQWNNPMDMQPFVVGARRQPAFSFDPNNSTLVELQKQGYGALVDLASQYYSEIVRKILSSRVSSESTGMLEGREREEISDEERYKEGEESEKEKWRKEGNNRKRERWREGGGKRERGEEGREV